jgi:hypothetical protein
MENDMFKYQDKVATKLNHIILLEDIQFPQHQKFFIEETIGTRKSHQQARILWKSSFIWKFGILWLVEHIKNDINSELSIYAEDELEKYENKLLSWLAKK